MASLTEAVRVGGSVGAPVAGTEWAARIGFEGDAPEPNELATEYFTDWSNAPVLLANEPFNSFDGWTTGQQFLWFESFEDVQGSSPFPWFYTWETILGEKFERFGEAYKSPSAGTWENKEGERFGEPVFNPWT